MTTRRPDPPATREISSPSSPGPTFSPGCSIRASPNLRRRHVAPHGAGAVRGARQRPDDRLADGRLRRQRRGPQRAESPPWDAGRHSRVGADGVYLEDSYRSEPCLDVPPVASVLGGTGEWVVGMQGWWARNEVRGIGLYLVR